MEYLKNITWIGKHEGRLRDIARGVKLGDPDCITIAAGLFAQLLPRDCLIIPMPSHYGKATRMRSICMRVVNTYARGHFFDALECIPHESNYDQKKEGRYPAPITMYMPEVWKRVVRNWAKEKRPVFILDNVIDTGVTARGAILEVPQATVFSITKTNDEGMSR